jgi:hypothetical protein
VAQRLVLRGVPQQFESARRVAGQGAAQAISSFREIFSEANRQAVSEDKRAEALAEIAQCKQRIQNAEKLYLMARLDEKAFQRHIDENERQIARLQADLSEEAQIRQVLEMAVTMLADTGANWERATNEDRQAFAQSLFSEIVFDLDTRQIAGFKLKPWAEPFLQVRVEFNLRTVMAPEGYGAIPRPRVSCATLWQCATFFSAYHKNHTAQNGPQSRNIPAIPRWRECFSACT